MSGRSLGASGGAIARFKAAGCVSNILDKYTAPGFTCTIGDMTFADFTWTPSDTTGGTAPPAASEMVVPDGLGFDLDGLFAASSGATQTLSSTIRRPRPTRATTWTV